MTPLLRIYGRYVRDDLAIFVISEAAGTHTPANGGLRLLPYPCDRTALDDGRMLAARMGDKHRLYGTGFRGGKIVVRADPAAICRQELAVHVGELLTELGGRMYTGCDLNFGEADATRLHGECPYVLAALAHAVDASTATGRGVAASALAAIAALPTAPHRALVHGTGATGRVVAERLRDAGLEVVTVDRVASRADIDGCVNASHRRDWWNVAHDVLVPCSASRLIDDAVASELGSRLIVSAANGPLTDAAEALLRARGCVIVPDAVSNAGAVIVDSVEFFASDAYAMASAADLYGFVERLVAEKTRAYLEAGPGIQVTDLFAAGEPCGATFRADAPALGPRPITAARGAE